MNLHDILGFSEPLHGFLKDVHIKTSVTCSKMTKLGVKAYHRKRLEYVFSYFLKTVFLFLFYVWNNWFFS